MGLGLLWFQAASIRLKSNMLGVKLGASSQHLLGGRCLVSEFETRKDIKCLLEVTWFLRKQGCITLPPHLAPMLGRDSKTCIFQSIQVQSQEGFRMTGIKPSPCQHGFRKYPPAESFRVISLIFCVVSVSYYMMSAWHLGWDNRNIIHGSDGPETAVAEIGLWFKPEELVNYTHNAEKWLYE
jgi:hypothetical protein